MNPFTTLRAQLGGERSTTSSLVRLGSVSVSVSGSVPGSVSVRVPLGLGVGFVIAIAGLAGCAKSKSEPAAEKPVTSAAPAPAPASSAQPNPASAGTGAGTAGPIGRAIVTIQDKLDVEKEGRPKDTPSAEQVFAAVEQAGVALTDKKQHVGAVYGAAYCVGAKSGGVAYSACEYESADAAKAGRDTSMKAFQTGNREIYTNKKTTLTVLQPSAKTPASEAVVKKSVEAFKKL